MRRSCIVFLVVAIGSTGCAGTWDTISSRRFRNDPIGTVFDHRDPLNVMRTSPEGDDRAAAMRKLKEPLRNDRGQAEQDEALKLLTDAALNDPSPVVRVAAIDALGRFEDPLAVRSLVAAYYQAGGSPPDAKTDKFSLLGPVGFAPEVASLLRGRAVEGLAKTGSAEALPVLTQVATGVEKTGGSDRDTRLAAVRGLRNIRSAESVAALNTVLAMEKTRDPALADRAHEGLVSLTGQRLPSDPQEWDLLVRNGKATVVPEPNVIQQATSWVLGQ